MVLTQPAKSEKHFVAKSSLEESEVEGCIYEMLLIMLLFINIISQFKLYTFLHLFRI